MVWHFIVRKTSVKTYFSHLKGQHPVINTLQNRYQLQYSSWMSEASGELVRAHRGINYAVIRRDRTSISPQKLSVDLRNCVYAKEVVGLTQQVHKIAVCGFHRMEKVA